MKRNRNTSRQNSVGHTVGIYLNLIILSEKGSATNSEQNPILLQI